MTGKFLVQSVTKATTKRGKTYLRLRLFEPGGRAWPAVMWDIPANMADNPEALVGQLVDALAEEGEFGGEAQLNIKALRLLDEKASDLFLPHTKADVASLLVELRGFVEGVQNTNLRGLLLKALDDPRWPRAPAASLIHHAYLGGLLEHTVNLCRLSDRVAALYPVIRRDLLITASVLHDIGKMDELACGTNIEYTCEGNLLGHLVIGLLRVDAWMAELTMPEELRLLVRHLIISHHGNPAMGSPKSPQILEAQVFSGLDGVDANMGAMLAAIDRAGTGKEWADRTMGKERLFLGRYEEAQP